MSSEYMNKSIITTKGHAVSTYTVVVCQLIYTIGILFLGPKCWTTTEAFFWPEDCHADSLPAVVVPLGNGRPCTSTQQLLFSLFE